MKIGSNDSYLAVALHTLETKIAPELTSSDAQASAQILKQVLGELLKRELTTPPLLIGEIETGHAIADCIEAFCAEAGISVSARTPAPTAPIAADTSFAGLAAHHEWLSARLADLAATLSGARAGLDDAVHQQRISALLHDVGVWDERYALTQRDMAIPMPPPTPPIAGAPLDRTLFEAFLQTQHPDGAGCTVTDLKPIPGGFGKQTFRASIRDAAGAEQQLIVRKSDPTPMVRKGCFLIEEEFHLLRDVAKQDALPVAAPLWLGKDVPGVDADFYVMSTLPGAVPSSFLGAASAVIPEAIVLQMARYMARLHRLTVDQLPDYVARFGQPGWATDTIETCYRRHISEWKAYYEQNDHLPAPFVIYLLDWLDQNVPKRQERPVLVHGDFNIHNVLADGDVVTGILDWECAMIGAPEQDLAYVRPIISQHIAWDRFLDHYAASGGPAIDRASLDFYMAFSAMRLCVIFNKGVRNMQDGITRDIRYAVVDLGLTPEFMKQALACTGG